MRKSPFSAPRALCCALLLAVLVSVCVPAAADEVNVLAGGLPLLVNKDHPVDAAVVLEDACADGRDRKAADRPGDLHVPQAPGVADDLRAALADAEDEAVFFLHRVFIGDLIFDCEGLGEGAGNDLQPDFWRVQECPFMDVPDRIRDHGIRQGGTFCECIARDGCDPRGDDDLFKRFTGTKGIPADGSDGLREKYGFEAAAALKSAYTDGLNLIS